MDKDKTVKLLKKALTLEKGKELALAKEFITLDEKIENTAKDVEKGLTEIKEELKKKLDEELVYEVDEEKITQNVLSKIPIPKDGEDYVLTEQDKKDIAKSIKVPIVEKVIEKTEVIRETPIVTNEIKEVAVADTGEEIKDKLETLKDNERLDSSAIKGLDKIEKNVTDRAISILDQRTQFLINKGVKHDNTLTGSGTDADPLHVNNSSSETFETVSKNLKGNPYTLNYTGSQLTSIVYTLVSGTITKTLNYTGDLLTSLVLSGDTPSGIDLTKTLNYTGSTLTSITYS